MEDKCPYCNREHEVLQVCSVCRHELTEEDLDEEEICLSPVQKFIVTLMVILITILIVWVFGTIFLWLFYNWNNHSLLEIIKSQVEHVKKIRIY